MIQSFSIPSIFKQKNNGQNSIIWFTVWSTMGANIIKYFLLTFELLCGWKAVHQRNYGSVIFSGGKKLAALSMFHMSCTFFTISHSQLCLFDREVFFISTHACKVKKTFVEFAEIFLLHSGSDA